MRSTTTKVNSEYYVPQIVLNNNSEFNSENVLLCQYDILDVASHLAHSAPNAKILVHNFANNIQPCGGLWDGTLPENNIYNRTNLRQLVLPIRHKLYPIQDNESTVNLIITENCQIYTTSDNKEFADPRYVDVASLDAIVAPKEKNLDMYTASEYPRFDYASQADRDQMEARITFLLDYATGEGYDYLLTGAWGVYQEMNPHWGLIELWNSTFTNMGANKLRIIFCIPILEGDDDSLYNYKYFNKYLIGQDRAFNLNKIKETRRTMQLIAKLTIEESTLKRKIYGLVWGCALAEMLANYNVSAVQQDVELSTQNKWCILQSEYTLDWDSCTDRVILLARALCSGQMNIIPATFAANLVTWKSSGFSELQQRPLMCQDQMMKHLLSQRNYVMDPISIANSVYIAKGASDTTSLAIGGNALNGIFKDYARRTLLYCMMIQPDTACRVACLVHSYIINCIWYGKYITTQDWGALIANCNKIFDTNSKTSIQHKILFDHYWSIGRNYQYQISGGILDYVRVHLNKNSIRPVNHTFTSMALAIILMYDIQGHIPIHNKLIRNMMNITDIPMIDDQMRDKAVSFHEHLPPTYFFDTINDLSKVYTDITCLAVAGSVLGLVSWQNVYNDEIQRDPHSGESIESASQQWIKYAENAEWLNSELDNFANIYLEQRRQAVLDKQNIIEKKQSAYSNRSMNL